MGFGKRRNSRVTKMALALFHLLLLVWPLQPTLCKQAYIIHRNMGLEAETTWHIADLTDWPPTNPILAAFNTNCW